MKKLGFTLVETLIVLGIIGVISALTLPNVMADYQRRTYVTSLQRFYNQMKNAVQKYKMEQHVDELKDSDLISIDGVEKFLANNFNVTRDCGDTPQPCFADSYSSIDKTVTGVVAGTHGTLGDGGSGKDSYCVALDTGASICMTAMQDGVLKSSLLAIDVNGAEAPNIMGRDYFVTFLWNNGRISEEFDPKIYTKSIGNVAQKTLVCETGSGALSEQYAYATHCFDKITADGWQMDY